MLAGPERAADGEVKGSMQDWWWWWILCVSPPLSRIWSYLVAGVALESHLLNYVFRTTGGEAAASVCNERKKPLKDLNFPGRLNIQILIIRH